MTTGNTRSASSVRNKSVRNSNVRRISASKNDGAIRSGGISGAIRSGVINRVMQSGNNSGMIGNGRNEMIANVGKESAMNAKWSAVIGKATSSGMTASGKKTSVINVK